MWPSLTCANDPVDWSTRSGRAKLNLFLYIYIYIYIYIYVCVCVCVCVYVLKIELQYIFFKNNIELGRGPVAGLRAHGVVDPPGLKLSPMLGPSKNGFGLRFNP